MATYSLTNFAVIDGQFILIYDIDNQLRNSIIPHETQFYARYFDCIIEVNGISTDKYHVLDFSSVSEAEEATTILNNLKHTILYDINGWQDITNKPSSISGYTIGDAYTKIETNANFLSASTSTYYADTLIFSNTSTTSIIMTDVVNGNVYGVCISGGTLTLTQI